MMGIMREFDHEGLRQRMFVLDGIPQAGKPVIC